jgi:hypothetical protein
MLPSRLTSVTARLLRLAPLLTSPPPSRERGLSVPSPPPDGAASAAAGGPSASRPRLKLSPLLPTFWKLSAWRSSERALEKLPPLELTPPRAA